jgi:large subunit ribosomal protein L1
MAQGKRIKEAYKGVDAETFYPLDEAIKKVKSASKVKFDETIEVAIALGIDPRNSEQNVRGVISMPNGIGKAVKVAVFARDQKAEEAKKAGADIVGDDDLVEKIQKGEISFERCIATPDMMGTVGKVAKILGPKGLMPNPKLGTVTEDVAEAVKSAKSGQVEFRNDKAGIIHAGVGKVSFDDKALQENIAALVTALTNAKPSGAKGTYIKKAAVASSMGPGLKVDVATVVGK